MCTKSRSLTFCILIVVRQNLLLSLSFKDSAAPTRRNRMAAKCDAVIGNVVMLVAAESNVQKSAMRCPSCLALVDSGNRFCGQCGTRLTDAPVVANGLTGAERRQVTVMFYDLVGSTALATHADPEDFREAIAGFHRVVAAAVEPFGAFVGAHVGDGGIIYFGYPKAQEDAAERAALAGLRLVEAVQGLVLPGGHPGAARVGIATGEGVVGRLEDGDAGNTAVGRVTSLAARLQAVARPGTVVVGDATRRLIGKLFRLDNLGTVEAKGFAGGVRAWRILGPGKRNRFDALHDSNVPLVGRALELARGTCDRRAGGWEIATRLGFHP